PASAPPNSQVSRHLRGCCGLSACPCNHSLPGHCAETPPVPSRPMLLEACGSALEKSAAELRCVRLPVRTQIFQWRPRAKTPPHEPFREGNPRLFYRFLEEAHSIRAAVKCRLPGAWLAAHMQAHP